MSAAKRQTVFVAMLLTVLSVVSHQSVQAQASWPARAGGTGVDVGNSVSVLADGSAIVTGRFSGTATFGATSLTSDGGGDAFVAKISASGAWIWANQVGGATFSDEGRSVSVSADGSAIVTGYFQGTATFGATTLTSTGGGDAFVAKINAYNGLWEWAIKAGGYGLDIVQGASVSALADGSAIVTGYFEGTSTFGATTLASLGVADVFVAKISAAGAWEWATRAGGLATNYDYGNSVSVLADGSAIVTGQFEGTATFGFTLSLTSAGSTDVFVAKINAAGTWVWATKAGGDGIDHGNSVSVLANGSAIVTGQFEGAATFGATPPLMSSSVGFIDVFVAKISAAGEWEWATKAGGSARNIGSGVSVLADGSAFVTGLFSGAATFGTIPLLTGGGDGPSVFVAKISAVGAWLWATKAGGDGIDYGNSVSVLADGAAIVTGLFEEPATFGTTPLTSAGLNDVFVARISPDGIFGTATQMAINAGNNQTATVGTPVATMPSVLVRDALNNPVVGITVTFSVASGGGLIRCGPGLFDVAIPITTDASGVASTDQCRWFLGPVAGINTMTATSSGLTGSPLTFTATGTAGAATQMAINAGNNQMATVGTAVATVPSVVVRDASNNPVSGVPVTFAVATGGGTISGGTATTNASGIATVGSWTLGATPGTNTLTATVVGLTGSPQTFTATGTVGAATQITIDSGNNQTATVGRPVDFYPSVLVRDALNNPVVGIPVTFRVASGGGIMNCGLPGLTGIITTTTDASGVANTGCNWVLGPVPGFNTMTATSSGLTGSPLTFTATGTVGPATQTTINAGNNQTAMVGTAVVTAPSVVVRDALNNPVAGLPVTFVVESGGGSVSGGTTTTNTSGIATVGSWTLGPAPGINTLRACWGDLCVTFLATGAPTIVVNPSQPGSATGPGGTGTITQNLTNPSSTPADAIYVASLPEGLAAVSCSAPFGTCVIGSGAVIAPGGGEIYRTLAAFSVASTTTVTWTGTIPANGSVTISYQVRTSAVATAGTQYLITSTINGSLGPSATVTVSASPVGPGDPVGLVLGQAAAQKPGSVLIYNLYTSGFNPTTNDSRISITNTSPSRRAYVHFFFVDGSNCSVADMTITLTANQTTSFLASDFDPGVTGYLIAVATDSNGCPAIQNDLIGESLVKLESGHRATLPALGVAALGLGGPTCNPNATMTTLAFDGLSYNALPRTLAVSGLSSIANGFSSLLVVNRVGGNLGTGAATLGSLFGLLYDDQEMSQSFTLPANVCQLRGVLGNNFPRTAPRYTTVIPAGRTGWMRFAAVADEAITGALLVEAQNGLGGGHNLHHLTTTSTATLTIPVFPVR